MAISPQRLTIYSAHRAVIFAIAQLSCSCYTTQNSWLFLSTRSPSSRAREPVAVVCHAWPVRRITCPFQPHCIMGPWGCVKMQDIKMKDQVASHENAGRENAGQLQHNTTHRQFTRKLEFNDRQELACLLACRSPSRSTMTLC